MFIRNNLFMVNVTTQTVVRVNRTTGDTEVVSSNEPSTKLLGVHGGSNLILFSSPFDQATVWLAVVHTKSAKATNNVLVEFEYAPPFHVRRVSNKLPLHVHRNMSMSNHSRVAGGAFASGLATLPHDAGLLITYGSSDLESRVCVLTPDGTEALFASPKVSRMGIKK
jgi:hypothetical protein